MKLINKECMSQWAYFQCKEGNDSPDMRDLITKSYWAYLYCLHIKDIEEMWRKIKQPPWAYWYCIEIKNRLELRDLVRKYTDEIKI